MLGTYKAVKNAIFYAMQSIKIYTRQHTFEKKRCFKEDFDHAWVFSD